MKRPIALTLVILAAAITLRAVELKPQSVEAFDRYVRLTEARMETEITGATPLLALDRLPQAARDAFVARLKRGEVIVERQQTLDNGRAIEVKDALLHHWLGTILIPGVKLDPVIAYVQEYEKYSERFAPTIQRSRLIARHGDHFDVAMRTRTHKIITVVIDAEYGIDYRPLSPTRMFTKSVSRNVMEVDKAGEPGERRTPAEHGTGYLWRLYNYCWFDERAEGVFEQCESISLTREVPFGLGWLVKPFITGLPRETVQFTLGKVREGVTKKN